MKPDIRAVFITGEHVGMRCVISGDNEFPQAFDPFLPEICEMKKTGVISRHGEMVYVEVEKEPPRLVILGAGHVAKPVAHLGKMLGFLVTVMDDRGEFLTPEAFPDADERIVGEFRDIADLIPEYESACYVILTRGHSQDGECLRRLLKRPCLYLGMIGSRRKVALTREMLLEEGFTPEQLAAVHAPIGLDIGAETPEEIAVSIMAQIIQETHDERRGAPDLRVEKALKEGRKGVLMTLVNKLGSAPREIGCRMLLDEDGNSYGTIGGGSVEYAALSHAPAVTDPEVVTYSLDGKTAQGKESICGGSVMVLFARL